jgi:hypothetical protein
MQRIGEQIGRELGRFGPAAGMAELVAAWPAAVGEAIARNAWPARLGADRTLHVATSSSAWAFELTQLAPDLLERLRQAAPEAAPRKLRFAVGRLPEPDDPALSAPSEQAVAAGPQERAAAVRLAAGIADADLRELVARAAAAGLARAGSSR